MIEIRTFGGKLNLDDSTYRVPQGDYVGALNITRDAEGQGQDEVLSNINGNAVVSDTLPSGINKVIGNYADRLRNRLYFFTWNDGGFNRISYYDRNTGNITVLMEDLTDTNNVGVLNFDPSYRINHIDIVYRENEQGDLLFWTDGLNPPSKINVLTAETGGYGVIQRSYIDVAKEPPSAPPYCVYEDDVNVTVNNLNNKQFKFKYRFVYDDLEKSVTSAQSVVPIPFNYSDATVFGSPSKNSNIFIVFQTGQQNVTKIELLASQSLGDNWSDFFLIKVIDKDDLQLNSNDVSTYRFYNDEAYNTIDIRESIQPFDNVPQVAYTQSLPNGNVLDYGAITEGYDLIIPDYETTILPSLPATLNNQYLLAQAYQNGEPTFGSGDVKIILAGNVPPLTQVNINVLISNVPYTITGTTDYVGSSVNNMLTRLEQSAISGGFSTVSLTNNELIISQPDVTIVNSEVIYHPFIPITVSNNSNFAYDWSSRYSYGVVYFDDKGRTNGVFTTFNRPIIVNVDELEVYTASFNYTDADGSQKAVPYPIQTTLGGFTPNIANTSFTYSGDSFLGTFESRVVGSYIYTGSVPFFIEVKKNGTSIFNTSIYFGPSPSPSTPVVFDFNITPFNISIDNGDVIEVFVTHLVGGTWNLQLNTAEHYIKIVGQILQNQGSSAFITKYYQEDLDLTGVYVPKLPLQQFSINSRPPIWAKYFQIVRTKNLSKSNFLYWISSNTYKDSFANDLGFKYAYISIETLASFSSLNPEIKNLGYEFTVGDRIRFIKRIYPDTTTANTYSNRDYEIVESLTNPTINGQVAPGQILKIILPNVNVNFDFGSAPYQNYLIEIYTPSVNFSNELNLYYEFGEKYLVGDAGLSTRYHQGMTQDQADDLSVPALYEFVKGDSYFRYRFIPLGDIMTWQMNPYSNSYGTGFTNGGTLIKNTYNGTDYAPVSALPSGNNVSLINISNTSKEYSFFIKGKIRYSCTASGVSYMNFATNLQNAAVQIGPYVSNEITEQEYTLVLNAPIGSTNVFVNISNFVNSFPPLNVLEWSITISSSPIIHQGIIDPNFSDFYPSSSSPNGRAWKYDPNAAQEFNPTLIRFGGEYQDGTTINNINRFYEENFDVYDRSRGSIKKMFIEGRNQYIFHEFDVGVVTILTQIVKDTAGNPLSAQSDTLLNKIVYPYIGQYGIGNVPESFAYGKSAKYFVDDNKGVVCRLSNDGITPISIVYKMNAFFVPALKGYRVALSQAAPDTGYPTVYGGFDAYTNKYIISMDAIYDGNDLIQNPFTLIFLDSRESNRGFETFASYHPENIGCLNNTYITFKDGNLWTHDTGPYCNFYGVQYGAYVDAAFNDRAIDRKTYLTIFQTSNDVWYCPSITSQLNTYGSTKQQSQIVAARFVELEGQYTSAILRDINSPGGLINGQTMHGNYLVVRFQKDSASNFYFLNTVSLTYVNSPLNPR